MTSILEESGFVLLLESGSRSLLESGAPVTVASGYFPIVEISIDFAHNPREPAYTWVDVTNKCRGFTRSMGRSDPLGRFDTGTLSLTLDNRNGNFNPTNASGAYYPNVKPMRRIRVRYLWNDVYYDRFLGYISNWPLSFPNAGFDSVIDVSAVDGLGILAQFDIGGRSYPAQRTDERIQAVLEDCGFDTSIMSLQVGVSTVDAAPTFSVGTTAQSHILDVVASENGAFFVNGAGTFIFQNRHYRPISQRVSTGTIGNATDVTRYRDIETSYGIGDVWNTVVVTPAGGGAVQTATDAASDAAYFTRTLSWPTGGSYLVSDEDEALNAAQYMLLAYGNPQLRVPEVVTIPARRPATDWPFTLSRNISDRITIAQSTTAGGTLAGDKFIEGISETASITGDYTISFRLSDTVPALATYWLLEDVTLGQLGSTTVLGF